MLYCAIDFIIKKTTNSVRIKLTIQGTISSLMFGLGCKCSLTDFNGVNRIFSCYIMFYIGIVLKVLSVPKKEENKKCFYSSLKVSFFIISFLTR